MATGALFLRNGIITLVPLGSDPSAKRQGDFWIDSADGLIVTYNGSTNRKMVATEGAQTVSSKTLNDTIFTGTVTGLTKSDVGLGNVDNYSAAQLAALAQTLTNKTIDGDDNTLLDISISSLKTDGAAPLTFISRDGSGVVISTKAVPTGVVVGTTDSQTLTNKTLTLPVIAQISNTGTLTLPTSTDTLVGRATTDTLTNKTLTSPTINTATISTPAITGGTQDGPNISTYEDFSEVAAPSTPSAGKVRVYAKSDGNMYFKDDAGTEVPMGLGTGTVNTTNIVDGAVTRAKLESQLNWAIPKILVNFSGLQGSGTYSGTLPGTITISMTGHTMQTGHSAYLDFTSGGLSIGSDGWYTVTRINANSFSISVGTGIGAVSGNVSRTMFIRSSSGLNTSSPITRHAAGQYTLNYNSAFATTDTLIMNFTVEQFPLSSTSRSGNSWGVDYTNLSLTTSEVRTISKIGANSTNNATDTDFEYYMCSILGT